MYARTCTFTTCAYMSNTFAAFCVANTLLVDRRTFCCVLCCVLSLVQTTSSNTNIASVVVFVYMHTRSHQSAGEVGTPSAALLAAPWFSGCSNGQTNQFDQFADNVCFGHTFTGCIRQQPCPIASATLRICIQAGLCTFMGVCIHKCVLLTTVQ